MLFRSKTGSSPLTEQLAHLLAEGVALETNRRAFAGLGCCQ